MEVVRQYFVSNSWIGEAIQLLESGTRAAASLSVTQWCLCPCQSGSPSGEGLPATNGTRKRDARATSRDSMVGDRVVAAQLLNSQIFTIKGH